MSMWFWLAYGYLSPLVVHVFVWKQTGHGATCPRGWAWHWMMVSVLSAALFLSMAPFRLWQPACGSSAAGVTALVLWLWRRRKDHRRVLARWGARELARLRSMVATLRDRARPRPVFRPGRVPA